MNIILYLTSSKWSVKFRWLERKLGEKKIQHANCLVGQIWEKIFKEGVQDYKRLWFVRP